MNNRIATLLIILLAGIGASAQDTLRIMSYNIRNCRGIDNVFDIGRTAEAIRKADADFIALQEVDSVTNRSQGISIADTLATLCNMKRYYSAAIDYDGGKYGVAILCKEKANATYGMPLPGSEESRTILIAEYPDFFFASTHLSLTEEDRLASLAIIDSIAAKAEKPFIIAGDLNDDPQSRFFDNMLRNWDILSHTDRFTFPADNPYATIDYIAIFRKKAGNVKKTNATVIDEPEASDHRPVAVSVMIE